jgi:peptidyl-dipeptidase A
MSFGLRRCFTILALISAPPVVAAQAPASDSTVAAARRFLDAADRELAVRNVTASRAAWISENYITHDTEVLAADAAADYAAAIKRLVEKARKFDRAALPPDVRRRFLLLKLQLPAPAPADSAQAAEMARSAPGSARTTAGASTARRAPTGSRRAATWTSSRGCSPSRATPTRCSMPGPVGRRSAPRCGIATPVS